MFFKVGFQLKMQVCRTWKVNFFLLYFFAFSDLPKRFPNLIIRVYPPGRSPTLVDTAPNNSEIASFCLSLLNTIRLLIDAEIPTC